MKTELVNNFGKIVQITKTQDLSNVTYPVDGHALLKVRYDVNKDVLKGTYEVNVTVNWKRLTLKESNIYMHDRSLCV